MLYDHKNCCVYFVLRSIISQMNNAIVNRIQHFINVNTL